MDPVTAIFLLILIFGVYRRSRENKNQEEDFIPSSYVPFESIGTLLTKQEKELLDLLKSVVVGRYIIHLKVSIKSLLRLKRNISKSARAGYWKKIEAHRADFVLCEPDSLKVVCVINLERRGQVTDGKVEYDKYMVSAFKEASLPFIHFKANYEYNENDVMKMLSAAVDIKQNGMAGNMLYENN